MKYTLAVAVLIGTISAAEPVWSLRSVNDHRTDSEVQKAYGDHSTTKANGRPPYQSAVQVESESDSESSSDEENVQVMGDDSESDHSKEFYNAWNAVKDEEEGYHRAIPAYFSGDSDDLFMRSMCKTYALEGKNKDGSPNGNFMRDSPVMPRRNISIPTSQEPSLTSMSPRVERLRSSRCQPAHLKSLARRLQQSACGM